MYSKYYQFSMNFHDNSGKKIVFFSSRFSFVSECFSTNWTKKSKRLFLRGGVEDLQIVNSEIPRRILRCPAFLQNLALRLIFEIKLTCNKPLVYSGVCDSVLFTYFSTTKTKCLPMETSEFYHSPFN